MIELRKTEVFAKWLDGLRDIRARARILVRIERLATGNPGDVKPVSEGVSEMRIDYGPGYRVYYKKAWAQGGDSAGRRRQADTGRGHQNRFAPRPQPVGTAMAKTVTTHYDVAEHLRTPEEMAAYLEASLEDANGDAAFIAKALGDIARAQGMSRVVRDAGLSRESLYKALSGRRSPSFDTILKVIAALGLRLHAEPVAAPGSASRQ